MAAAGVTGEGVGDLAKDIWKGILQSMRNSLLAGDDVTLTKIATIQRYAKKSSTYRHPSTGELETAPARQHLRLALSPQMKAELSTLEV